MATSSNLQSPIAKSRFTSFQSPQTTARVLAGPSKKKKDTTIVLEKTFNPTTQEYTDKMRLGVRLRAGLKNPKGFMEAAWAAPALNEKPWSAFLWLGGPTGSLFLLLGHARSEWSRGTLSLVGALLFLRDLDSRTHKDLVRATVKVAMSELHAHARERAPRPFRSAHARGGEKLFL